MVPPRREKTPQPHNDPVEPSPYDSPENAKEAAKRSPPARKGQPQTRGKDQIARDISTEGSRTRGRDQTAREMAGQRHQK